MSKARAGRRPRYKAATEARTVHFPPEFWAAVDAESASSCSRRLALAILSASGTKALRAALRGRADKARGSTQSSETNT